MNYQLTKDVTSFRCCNYNERTHDEKYPSEAKVCYQVLQNGQGDQKL